MLLQHIVGLCVCAGAAAVLSVWEWRRNSSDAAAAAATADGGRSGDGPAAAAVDGSAAASGVTKKNNRKKNSTEPPAAAATASLVAAYGEAAARIPPAELHRLASLVRAVHAARNWRDSRYLVTQAWARIEARAMCDEGGGWQQEFDPSHVSEARVAALAAVIDEELLGGLLRGRLTAGPWVVGVKGSGGGSGGGGKKGSKQRRSLAPQRAGADGGGGGGKGGGGAAAATGCSDNTVAAPVSERQQVNGTSTRAEGAPETATAAAEVAAAEAARQACSTNMATKSSSTGSGDSHHHHYQQQPQPPPPLSYRVVDAPTAGWLAYFDVDYKAVMINRARWAKCVSRSDPVNCEGVVCVSRLQMFMHTLAHEIVHAIVYCCFPDIDAGSSAYLEDGRHGPVFALLNRQLFGHTSNALARCNARAALGGGGG